MTEYAWPAVLRPSRLSFYLQHNTLRFVLLDGTRELITTRLAARKGHFMPPSLLDSQLATLEPTPDLAQVSIDATPDQIVEDILQQLAPAASA